MASVEITVFEGSVAKRMIQRVRERGSEHLLIRLPFSLLFAKGCNAGTLA